MHYYIFYKRKENGPLFYERTCETEDRAIERCKELESGKSFFKALFTVNELPKEQWFY